MKLILKNVGILESANIDIGGLTVIAGDNDTGKSTIGKIAYSLTKSFEDFEINYEKTQMKELEKYYRDFYVILRKEIDLRKNTELRYFMDNYQHYMRIDKKKLLDVLLSLRNSVENKEIEIDNIELRNWLNSSIKNIEIFFSKSETKDSKIIKSVKQIFDSEFQNQINNIFSKESRISALEGKNEIISLIVRNNKIIQDKNKKIDEIFPFESSIFIETPFILTYKESLECSGDIYHVRDLLRKLELPVFNKDKKLDISNIIQGEVYYDEDEDDFLYMKKSCGKNIKINILNSASGIRSFGIMQLLDNIGEFNRNILLIIDEPEVHLHPGWQVEYAKLLVNLVRSGVTILIASHSPYLIEAINKYSKKENIEGKTKFYLSELKENGKAIITDKTKEKDEIFDKLSKPFERLVFGD